MAKMDWKSLSLPIVIEPIIKKAGELILSYFKRLRSIQEKENGGFVTEADLASEQYLMEQLQPFLPGASFIGEELGKNDGTNDYCWVIDPLDGTTNFMHGLPYFCISISLTLKGIPQFGAVYQPLTNEYFYAERGKGAFLNGKKLQVSTVGQLSKSVVVIGFPYKKEERFKHLLNLMNEIFPKIYAFRNFGAAALDLANVACGRLDGHFFEDLGWWDVAAGTLLVEEAGGIVTDFEGKPIRSDFKTFVTAGPGLHERLRKLLVSN